MRTAEDFNLYYATPDPWHISRSRFRDRVLRRCLGRFIRDKSVLELGCGEGHLTRAVFGRARSVVGILLAEPHHEHRSSRQRQHAHQPEAPAGIEDKGQTAWCLGRSLEPDR